MTRVASEEIARLHHNLSEDAQPSQNYLVLTLASGLIASFGLLSNSAAAIIGAMIIAPLMLPLRGLALAILEGDLGLFYLSIRTVGFGAGLGMSLAWLMGRLFNFPEFGAEILARTRPTLIDLAIAVVAGGVAGFAKVRPQVGDALAGTAIAVALMPPLCVVGLSLAQGEWGFAWGAFLLYVTNLLGIILACMMVFLSAGYAWKTGSPQTWAFKVTLALNALLVIPLGISLGQLVRQSHLEKTLETFLQTRTITVGQQVALQETQVFWNKIPPEVRLKVAAQQPITPKQVEEVQKFLQQEWGQTFRIVFEVSQVQEVTAEGINGIPTRDVRRPSSSPQPSDSKP